MDKRRDDIKTEVENYIKELNDDFKSFEQKQKDNYEAQRIAIDTEAVILQERQAVEMAELLASTSNDGSSSFNSTDSSDTANTNGNNTDSTTADLHNHDKVKEMKDKHAKELAEIEHYFTKYIEGEMGYHEEQIDKHNQFFAEVIEKQTEEHSIIMKTLQDDYDSTKEKLEKQLGDAQLDDDRKLLQELDDKEKALEDYETEHEDRMH